MPLHHQALAGAVFTPALHRYLARHSDAVQISKELVGATLDQEEKLLVLLHLGPLLLQPSLFLLQGQPQLLLQLPGANHRHTY